MTRLNPLAAAAIGLLAVACASTAQPSGERGAASSAMADGAAEPQICRTIRSTGARTSSERICMTSAQWTAEASASRRDLDRAADRARGR